MSAPESIVVVGGGLAGAKTVESLRAAGYGGELTLIGDEVHLPYERPPLSKGYLMGKTDRADVFVHPKQWYDDNQVALLLGTPVASIARPQHRVELADGREVGYDKLVLATGAGPRALKLPGTDAAGVYQLRTLGDSDALVQLFGTASRLVVIGAGWIGMEVTAAARAAGIEVTVVEALELPLLRVLGPEVATVFAQLHREHGVDLRFGASVQEITVSDGRATGVHLGDGTLLAADAVLVAVGASPNTRLAEACGLKVDNGVVVDEALCTSDPDISAVGDVANAFHPLLQRHIRVEHWANALNQPAAAVGALLGEPGSYRNLPYFYTDQYDLGMEYVGYAEPGQYDRVVLRGDPDRREFVAFWIAAGRVVAGMAVNVWDVTDAIKQVITESRSVDVDRLADPDIPLAAV